jgi:hypothetical protein
MYFTGTPYQNWGQPVFLFLNERLVAVAQSDLRVTRPTPEAAPAASWIGAKW